MDEPIQRINTLRRLVLIHSCIYYRLGKSLVSDAKFDVWCRELVEIQKEHPKKAENGIYAEEFKDFDGTTGYDLPIGEPRVVDKAQRLVRDVNIYKKRKNIS